MIVELLSRANLTNTPCSERVKRLKQMGFISGYRAVLNMEKLGLGHLAGASDGGAGDSGSDKSLDAFNKAVRKVAEIEIC